MSIKSREHYQDIFVAYPEQFVRQLLQPQLAIRPILTGDTQLFLSEPQLCYIVREWMLPDDRTGCESANLDDMWGVVIVFRNGLHEHNWRAIPLHGRMYGRMPAALAFDVAEEMLVNDDRLKDLAALRKASFSDAVLRFGRKDDPRRIESRNLSRRAS